MSDETIEVFCDDVSVPEPVMDARGKASGTYVRGGYEMRVDFEVDYPTAQKLMLAIAADKYGSAKYQVESDAVSRISRGARVAG